MNLATSTLTPPSSGDSQADCIIRDWLKPYIGGVGRGMNVRVYTKEHCGACGKGYDAEMRCPEHRGVRPQKVFLSITGVKGFPDNRQKIYVYPDTKAALTLVNFMALKRQIEMEIGAGVYDPRKYDPRQTDRLRYRNYATYYLGDLNRRTEKKQGSDGWLSLSGRDDYEQYQRLYLIPYFGSTSLRDIGRLHVKNFLENMRSVKSGEPAGDTLKLKARDALRHMMNYAVEQEDIRPLAFEFPEVTRGKKVIQTLTQADQHLIIGAVQKRSQPIFRWLQATGRRVNEARALRFRDVDFRAKEYAVNGAFDQETYKPLLKVGATTGTVFPLDDGLAAIVGQALAGRMYGPDDYVFSNPHSGEHYTHRALNNLYDRARKKVGFGHVELNEFGRHSWATQRITEGWSYDQVAMFLLNSPQVVAQRYANVTIATRMAVIDLHRAAKTIREGGKK